MPKYPIITREVFLEATGREPKDDDLIRSNCPYGGSIGHMSCGWDMDANLPRFMSIPVQPVKIHLNIEEKLELFKRG